MDGLPQKRFDALVKNCGFSLCDEEGNIRDFFLKEYPIEVLRYCGELGFVFGKQEKNEQTAAFLEEQARRLNLIVISSREVSDLAKQQAIGAIAAALRGKARTFCSASPRKTFTKSGGTEMRK